MILKLQVEVVIGFECTVTGVAKAGKSVDSDDMLEDVIKLDTLDVEVGVIKVGDVTAATFDF